MPRRSMGNVRLVATRLSPRLTRLFDITVSLAALIALSPVILAGCVGVWLSNPGPVFFSQVRIGLRGKPFRIYKLRSMYTDAEERQKKILAQNQHGSAGVTFKMKHDPRIFWWGRIIRKLSIDELPQLWNVLNGSMAIVGPRPALPREVRLYSVRQRMRLEVKPGITCTWQVSGRADIPFEQQVDLDLEYITRHSVSRNFSLMVATVPAVLTGRGAY